MAVPERDRRTEMMDWATGTQEQEADIAWSVLGTQVPGKEHSMEQKPEIDFRERERVGISVATT